jgi:hypothetical protein
VPYEIGRYAKDNFRAVRDAWEDSEEFDDLASLMTDTPVANNSGRQASRRMPIVKDGYDGEIWPSAHKSLESSTLEARAGVQDGSLTPVTKVDLYYLGARSYDAGGSVLLDKEWESLDLDGLRSELLSALGFTREEYDLISRTGSPRPEHRALRERWDEALLTLYEEGGQMLPLARVMGWHIDASNHCLRIRRALKRARARRAAQHL